MTEITVTGSPGVAIASILPRPINNHSFVPVLIVVEGVHDVEFLRRLTANLHLTDPLIPTSRPGNRKVWSSSSRLGVGVCWPGPAGSLRSAVRSFISMTARLNPRRRLGSQRWT